MLRESVIVTDEREMEFHVQEILDRIGMSIQTLARKSGQHFETVRRIVNGTVKRLPLEAMMAICDVLDVDLSVLVTYKRRR